MATRFFTLFLLLVISLSISGQKNNDFTVPDTETDSYKPIEIKLNEDGSNYIRFIIWGQFWLTGQNNTDDNFYVNALVRRARIVTFAQISSRFLIFMHFGLNGLNDQTMNPLGSDAFGPQLFMHGVWSDFTVVPKKLYIGAGLHYWNGISRLTNEGTVNFLTLDNYRRAWSTMGLTDQFARHLGVFAKGTLGSFSYRVSINSNLINSLDVPRIPTTPNHQTLYTGKYEFEEDARWSYQGYFEYQFFDIESDKLPHKVGSYLGKKKVFNVGAGFFYHPKGSITYTPIENPGDSIRIQNNVMHFAGDVFYDVPVGRGAVTVYAVFYAFNYGPKYTLGQTYGTGTSFLVQAGYLFPKFSEKFRLQPYAAFNTSKFDAFENSGNGLRTGLNFFLNGHHAKFTLEYGTTKNMYNGNPKPSSINSITLQAQVFL